MTDQGNPSGAAEAEFAARVLRSLRSGLLAADGEGRIRALSEAALDILGRPGRAGPWLGRRVAELLDGEPELLALLHGAREGRDHPMRAELGLRRSGRRIGFTLLPVVGEPGLACGAALLFRDLAPFESSQEQARLQGRLAALGEMAAGLAHEIRNPLAAMEMGVGLLKRKLHDPEELELLEELQLGQREIAETIDACLAFVRHAPPERRPTELGALLRQAFATASRRVPLAVAAELPELDGPILAVDPAQLRGAVVDLCVNALQALREARTQAPALTLRAVADPEGGMRLEVEDNGPGVAAEDRERIFQPFFTTRAGGSGVGLASVQKIVSAHGGHLQLDSEPTRGTRFTIHLPAGVAS